MAKKEIRVMVCGGQRAGITVEAMVAIIIALGRERAARGQTAAELTVAGDAVARP